MSLRVSYAVRDALRTLLDACDNAGNRDPVGEPTFVLNTTRTTREVIDLCDSDDDTPAVTYPKGTRRRGVKVDNASSADASPPLKDGRKRVFSEIVDLGESDEEDARAALRRAPAYMPTASLTPTTQEPTRDNNRDELPLSPRVNPANIGFDNDVVETVEMHLGFESDRIRAGICRGAILRMFQDPEVRFDAARESWNFLRDFVLNLDVFMTQLPMIVPLDGSKPGQPRGRWTECIPGVTDPNLVGKGRVNTRNRGGVTHNLQKVNIRIICPGAHDSHSLTVTAAGMKYAFGCGLVNRMEWETYYLQDFNAKDALQWSHMCGTWWCVNPVHGKLEPRADNKLRARLCQEAGVCICGLNPPCIFPSKAIDAQAYCASLLAKAQSSRDKGLYRHCPKPGCTFVTNSQGSRHVINGLVQRHVLQVHGKFDDQNIRALAQLLKRNPRLIEEDRRFPAKFLLGPFNNAPK